MHMHTCNKMQFDRKILRKRYSSAIHPVCFNWDDIKILGTCSVYVCLSVCMWENWDIDIKKFTVSQLKHTGCIQYQSKTKKKILPRPFDKYWRQDARGEQEGHYGDVEEHGRVVHDEAASVRVEEGVAGDEGRRGEETGGDPDPREHGRDVESGDEAVADAVKERDGGDCPRSEK